MGSRTPCSIFKFRTSPCPSSASLSPELLWKTARPHERLLQRNRAHNAGSSALNQAWEDGWKRLEAWEGATASRVIPFVRFLDLRGVHIVWTVKIPESKGFHMELGTGVRMKTIPLCYCLKEF